MIEKENNLFKNTEHVQILYEDEYIIVLNKPYGQVVNRSKTSATNTLQDYIEENFDFMKGITFESIRSTTDTEVLSDEDIEEFVSRSGILHRLDKDTSGVLLVAKDPVTFKFIKEQFKYRRVQKEYVAIVMGDVKDEKIEIDAPIKRNPKIPFKFAVVSDGKPALTLIEKMKTILIDDQKFTALRVFPKTGRTHQIRVHLSAISHPIVCDPIYLTKHNYEETQKYFSRLMLHSSALTIEHPYTNTATRFQSPLPENFLAIIS